MIQRKQSLWLLISALLLLFPLFFPYVVITTQEMIFEGDTTGFTSLGSDAGLVTFEWPLMILNFIVILVSLVTIFLYKKRTLQMRLTVFNILLTIGLMILAGITTYSFISTLGADYTGWRLKWLVAILPLIAISLDVFAYRAIAIDEMTIRSMYRLRDRK